MPGAIPKIPRVQAGTKQQPRPLEQRRAASLFQGRKSQTKSKDEELNEPTKAAMTGATLLSGIVIFAIALFTDILDWGILLLEAISAGPTLGIAPVILEIIFEVLDIIIWAMISIWVFVYGVPVPPLLLVSGFIDLIPGIGDFVPTYALMMVAIFWYNVARKAAKKMISTTKSTAKTVSPL